MRMWTLTVDHDNRVDTTVHTSEDDTVAELRDCYPDDGMSRDAPRPRSSPTPLAVTNPRPRTFRGPLDGHWMTFNS